MPILLPVQIRKAMPADLYNWFNLHGFVVSDFARKEDTIFLMVDNFLLNENETVVKTFLRNIPTQVAAGSCPATYHILSYFGSNISETVCTMVWAEAER